MVVALVFPLLVADPAARLDAFLRAHSTFVAVTEYAVNGQTVGRSTLRVQRDAARIRFDAKGKGYDYTLSSTERGFLDLDRVEKVYDEQPALGKLGIYDSRISGAGALIPKYLFATTTAAIISGGKPTANPDELRALYRNPMGDVEVRLVVDAQGQPSRYSEAVSGRTRSWRLVSFAPGSKDLASYYVEAPLGYVPHALPELPTPLAIGSPAPLKGWMRLGKPLDLDLAQRGKPRLLAVLGDDYPSRYVRPFLLDLGRTMPVFLIGTGEITDPVGGRLKVLSPPGTPMFYLIGGDGKVKSLWFGFEREKGKAWEDEVRAAAVAK